jgi:uncharacterized protein (DUF111 family)
MRLEEVWQLEVHIDDLNPEICGYLSERLGEAGALDVVFLPAWMKKGRPAYQLTVLARREDLERMEGIIYRESTTWGIRRVSVQRTVLDRRVESVTTPWGTARVKVGAGPDGRVKGAPEYEDARRIARERDLPLREVYQKIMECWGQA